MTTEKGTTCPEYSQAVARFETHLDRAADEVFSTRMGANCLPDNHTCIGRGWPEPMSGSIVLDSGQQAALRMAERLMGAPLSHDDPFVRDAVGEVCNMVAGTWKNLDSELCTGCMLSTPTVVAGSSHDVFSQRAPIRIERS